MKLNLSKLTINDEDIDLPEIVTDELAEETGLHIGDGSMNFYKLGNSIRGSYALRGHFMDDKKHYCNIIKPLYKKIYNFDVSLRDMPITRVYGFQKWSNNLVNFKNKILNLPLGKKFDIQIPKVLLSKQSYVCNVIRGIFDTDGMLYLQPKYRKLYPRIEISTISKYLGLQLNKLINNLNIRSTIYLSKSVNPNWSDIYKISVRGDLMLDKWMKIINPNNPKHLCKYQNFINNS